MTQSSALRILHVIPSMASEAGGPPVVCAGLTAALTARGHQLAIATLAEPGKTPVTLAPGIQFHAFPPDRADSSYGHSAPLATWLDQNVSSFDLLHLHSLWQFPTFAAARAAWHHQKPYIVLLNGMLDHYSIHHRSYAKKRLYWLWRERRIHCRAAAIHCLNRAEIRRAVPWIKTFPKFILGNGIDAGELAALPARGAFRAAHPDLADKPLVLFLSRIHPKKGLDRLIPAWQQVAREMPDARLLIAGSGDAAYLASLKALIAAHRLESQMLFLGQLVGPAKWQVLVDADLFVLPSHQEGFSMAITEALAAGCPPVVTEECNFDELEPAPPAPPSGIIIRNGDMPAFAAAILQLLRDPARRHALASAGQSLVSSRYTWQNIAAQLEQTYRQILSGQGLPANPSP